MQQCKLMTGLLLAVLWMPVLVRAQSFPTEAVTTNIEGESEPTEVPSELPSARPPAPEAEKKSSSTAQAEQEKKSDRLTPSSNTAPPTPTATQYDPTTGFRWRSALKQSLLFLAVEHSFRFATEQGTRADLKGPFFRDWFESASNIRGWRDGDPFFVNYIGHPMQGAVTGFIQIQNDPLGAKLKPGVNPAYIRSRMRAFWWSAAYSTQFEIGPLSESSLGNVGLRPSKASQHPQAFVDMVITPVVGTAWLVGEDMLDHYLIRRVENKTTNRVARLLVRSFFNPGRSFANAMRGKYPWYRDDRKL